ncbi:two-component system sensor histidine kinase YesM [Paenibacillus rhizosphaerae]|uniref:Two-component system sensor histidine kinase YesM n=1 Tax=Paenibacillus rhizosphaerae TaxID=297318 RepID=A0A839TF65_9BACL|nr:sensor histidine kinase [Paenibacillus rhizosphaerae]MBB3125351.1 two-component system sensor histidine kinase YesM [Paenibacillus rhizosphaerae]
MKQLLNRLSLSKKITISFISIALVSVLSMNYLSNFYYSRATQQDFYNIAEKTTVSLNHELEIYFQQIAKSTYAMNSGVLRYSSVLLQQGDSGLIQDWLRDDSSLSPEKRTVVREILNKFIAFNYSEIEDIYLMSNDQRVLQANGVPTEAQLANLPWFNEPLNTELEIFPTFHLGPQNIPLIAVSIPIYDVNDTKISGRLVLHMRLTEINNIMGNMRMGETGYIFMVSEDGKIVYHPNSGLLGASVEETELSWLALSNSNSLQTWHGEQYLVSYSISEFTGWKTIVLVPLKEMATGLKIAQKSAIVVMTLLILLIMITVPTAANRITRPTIQLKKAMEKLQTGDLTVRAPISQRRDEIQLLSISFNRMAERLNDLVNTVYNMELKEVQMQLLEKQATIKALQNQINPHLLYNTLDIIKSIAYLEGVPKIEMMAGNLASLYRFTAKLEQEEISLAEELEHLKRYLEIIHIRYTRHFESKVYVDEKYVQVGIIKLSIQPIVENAVKYAVEPRNGKAAVMVSAYPEGNDLVIEIADNGMGFDPAVLENMKQRLALITDQPNHTKTSINSLGLTNVHNRLVLFYGKGYGIEIHSFPNQGTVISVRIPFGIKDNIS